MFKNERITVENLPPLIIHKELDTNIQIVCNYLKLLKSGKISEKDLIIKDISLTKDDIKKIINEDIIGDVTTIDFISLEQKECEKLIRNLFKNKLEIENPTYYQIIPFINILAEQLKKFSMNYTLTSANLLQIEILLKEHSLKNVRELIFNSFIINTSYFTLEQFHKILRAQHLIYLIKIESSSDMEKEQEMIEKALSELKENISCNKIHPGLIFFNNENDQDFKIINMNESKTKEYMKLLQLKKSLIKVINEEYYCHGLDYLKEQIPNELTNYRKFKHEQLLKEIIDILFSTKFVCHYD